MKGPAWSFTLFLNVLFPFIFANILVLLSSFKGPFRCMFLMWHTHKVKKKNNRAEKHITEKLTLKTLSLLCSSKVQRREKEKRTQSCFFFYINLPALFVFQCVAESGCSKFCWRILRSKMSPWINLDCGALWFCSGRQMSRACVCRKEKDWWSCTESEWWVINSSVCMDANDANRRLIKINKHIM